MILSRWQAPSSVDVDDLVQEMFIAVWAATHGEASGDRSSKEAMGSRVKPWEPTHGNTLRTYATFHAIDKGRKFLHKKRKAGHLAGAGPSRFEMPFTSFEIATGTLDGVDVVIERLARVEPEQEKEIAIKQMLDKAGAFRPVVEVFRETGSIEQATEYALSHQATRDRVAAPAHAAAKKVRGMIENMAEAL